MKFSYSFISFFLLTILFYACKPAQTKEIDFAVRGNCEMCKERIESTALQSPGVIKASWTAQTKVLSLQVDSTIFVSQNTHNSIAQAGHSTSEVEATNQADSQLPECCRKGFKPH